MRNYKKWNLIHFMLFCKLNEGKYEVGAEPQKLQLKPERLTEKSKI